MNSPDMMHLYMVLHSDHEGGNVSAMGLLAQNILNRAEGTPLVRPKSVSTEGVEEFLAKSFPAQLKDTMNPISHLQDPNNQVWHQHGFVENRPVMH